MLINMKTTIYLDVLVLLNIYIGYLLIASTKKLLGITVKRSRMITACLASGLFSLMILFDLNFLLLTIIKIVMGLTLSFIAFYSGNIRFLIKSFLMFFLVNFIFGGMMLCLWYFVSPSSMQFKNGVVYFNISSLTLAVSAIAAYLIIIVFTYMLNKRTPSSDMYMVTLSMFGRETILNALCDTGNKLTDVFTGLPIMVCELSSIKEMLPPKLYDYLNCPESFTYENNEDYLITKKIRVVPINAVSGKSSLMAFKPDKISLIKGNKTFNPNAIVAVTNRALSDGVFNALISPSMLV